MVKSMFAGVAGLRTHQAKMDVIGNNIANVNTWGFKAGSMSFKDTMYQNTSSGSKGSTAAGGYGGTNANQIGYGVTTGVISYDFSMGSPSPSARGLDCYIDGTGFYIVGPMVGDGEGFTLEDSDVISSKGLSLSRVGQFTVDNQGYLVDDSGNYVYGFSNTSSDYSGSDSFDTTSLKPLRIPMESDMAAIGNKTAAEKVNEAKKVLEEARANLSKLNLDLANTRDEYIAADKAYNDASEKIVIAPPDPATTTIKELTTARNTAKDKMNEAYQLWLDGKNDPANADKLKSDYDAARKKYEKSEYDLVKAQASLRAPNALSAAENATKKPDVIWEEYEKALDDYNAPAPTGGTQTLKDKLDEARKALDDLQTALSKIEPDSLEGKRDSTYQAVKKAEALVKAAENTVKEAEDKLETAQKNSTSTEVGNAGTSEGLAKLTNYTVLQDGTLTGSTENGTTVIVGKIALAGVQNVNGLEKTSGYYYVPGGNAGNISIYEAGGTQGRIMSNYLEMAKVDLATEMTDMITTQRGFQANSKIITVTDQMLEELVNIKR
ncbi:flagellar hook-basal body complex protein [Lacrimispora celerecrescens]|uniref:flagellar hook-basal body complex protein n=2 Tax=Lacrimispora TaxID=2719231 RepID=UPI00068BFF84|nr:flagellar hook-basal body complex protein [Lacrimispora celerecrescens]